MLVTVYDFYLPVHIMSAETYTGIIISNICTEGGGVESDADKADRGG